MKVKWNGEVEVSLAELAAFFCGMDDDSQAQFFVEVAKAAATWKHDPGTLKVDQWWEVGQHLRSCHCSSEEAREVVRSIYMGMTDT